MGNKGMNQPKKFYLTMLASLLLIIVFIIFLTSTMLYMSFESIALEQINTVISNDLVRVQDSTHAMVTAAKTLSMQVYYDSHISQLYLYPSLEWPDLNLALRQLESYRAIVPHIHSIYLYSNSDVFYVAGDMAANRMYVKNYFYDTTMLEVIDSLEDYPPFVPIPRIITNDLLTSPVYSEVFTFLFYDHFHPRQNANAVVAVNVYSEWMEMITGSNDGFEGDTILIADTAGNLMVPNQVDGILTDLSNQSYIAQILQSVDASGYFIDLQVNEKRLVNYSYFEELGWYFIRIIPYSEVVAEMNHIKNRAITVGLIILTAGLLVSLLISYRLYLPVNRIHERLLKLDSKNKNSRYLEKQELLRQCLSDEGSMDVNQWTAAFIEHDIKIDAEAGILLILIKIDHYLEFTREYQGQDKNLMKFAVLNIASEILQTEYAAEGMDYWDENMVLILNIDPQSTGPSERSGLTDMLRNIQALVAQHLSLSISMMVSVPGGTILKGPALMNTASDLFFYRLFHGEKSILFTEDLLQYNQRKYQYPAQMEKKLIDELLKGNLEEAKEQYLGIISEISQFSISAINLAFSHFVHNVNEAISTIAKHDGSQLNISTIILSLHQFERIEDVNEIFFEAFEGITQGLTQKKVQRLENIAKDIKEYVEQNYADVDLTLNSIAESLGLSAAYLGRTFKRTTNTTIGEYIIDVRMNQSKALLRSTDMTAKEIAWEVGFNNCTYFYKVFKKTFGITPNEFRKKLVL